MRANVTELLYFNEAFRNTSPEFGSSMTREDAMKYRQFRLKDIYSTSKHDPETIDSAERTLLLMLEHEVRGPSHRANPTLRRAQQANGEGTSNPPPGDGAGPANEEKPAPANAAP